jgi:CHAT domain-containing protein/tetratricopeptide (TPR) repeat protein
VGLAAAKPGSYEWAMWTLLLAVAFAQAGREAATTVGRLAQRAVEGDSVRAVQARWQARARRDSTDRAAWLGIAAIARILNDTITVDRVAPRLLAGPGRPLDAYAVYARLTLAGSYVYRGRLVDADSEGVRMQREAQQAGMRDAEAEALILLAQIRARTQGVVQSRELLRQAKPLIAPASHAIAATRACAEAQLAMRQGDTTALALAGEGRAAAVRAGSRRLQGGCEMALAQEYERTGHYDGAVVWFDKAAKALRQGGDRHMLSAALQLGAWSRYERGDYSGSRAAYADALREARAIGNVGVEAWSLLGVASIGSTTGDIVSARDAAVRAGALMRQQNDRWGLASARLLEADLADAIDDRPAARAAYIDAIAMQRAIGNTALTISANRQLAVLAQRDGKWDEADRYLAEATRLARGAGNDGWLAELPFHRGVQALGRGDYATAESLFTAVEVAENGRDRPGRFDHVLRYELQTRLAETRAFRGDLDGAETALRRASDELDRWRLQLSDRDLRLAVQQAHGSWGRVGRGVPGMLATLARAGRVRSAFAIAEGRRARELVDYALRRDVMRADTTVLARHVRRAGATLGLDEVAAALDRNTALLEYVAGRGTEPTTLFIVTRDTTVARTLPPLDSLGASIERFVALLSSGSEARGLARSLGAAIIGPALAVLPGRVDDIVIVPDGALFRVPFDALRTSDDRFLVERAAVSVAPSATAAVGLARRPANPRARTVIAFGDPRFPDERTTAGEATREAFADGGGLVRLPYSAREARRVGQYAVAPVVRLRGEASEAFVKQTRWQDVAIIHFATHALVDDRVLTRSVIALAAGEQEDGLLDPSEIAALRLDADLVVLSACRTAGGVVLAGEGLQGLTAPLLEAGARAVIASNWKLGDRSTLPFIDRLYAHLARGLPAGAALRQAKLDAIHDGARVDLWAAFSLVGDAKARPKLRTPSFDPIEWIKEVGGFRGDTTTSR